MKSKKILKIAIATNTLFLSGAILGFSLIKNFANSSINLQPYNTNIQTYLVASASNPKFNNITVDNVDENSVDVKNFIKSSCIMNTTSTWDEFGEIISFDIVEKSLPEGYIIINNVRINQYLDSNNETINKATVLDGDCKISGFFKVTATSIKNSNVAATGTLANKNVSEVTDEILKQWVSTNKNTIFSGLPLGFTDQNIVSVRIDSKKSSQGKMNVSVILDMYNDEQHQIQNKNKTFSFTITGFNVVNLETKIVKSTNPPFNSNLIAQEANQDIGTLKNYIFNNMIVNKPTNFTPNDINSFSSSYDNAAGTITIHQVVLKKYLDADGQTYYDSKTFDSPLIEADKWVISGYTKLSKTTVAKTEFGADSNPWSNQDVNQPSLSSLKDWVFKNINAIYSSTPVAINTNDFTISNVIRNAKEGFITLTVNLNRYYDEVCNIVNSPSLIATIKLSGFKITSSETALNATTIDVKKGSIYKDLTPTEIVNDKQLLKQFVIDEGIVKNPPPPYNATTIADVSAANPNNIYGTFQITSILMSNSLDADGNVTNNNKILSGLVRVEGLATIKQTTYNLVNNQTIDQNNLKYFPDYNNAGSLIRTLSPTNASKNQLNLILNNYIHYLFSNLCIKGVNGASESSVIEVAEEPIVNSNKSSVEVSFNLKNYFNNQGLFVSSGLPYTLTINFIDSYIEQSNSLEDSNIASQWWFWILIILLLIIIILTIYYIVSKYNRKKRYHVSKLPTPPSVLLEIEYEDPNIYGDKPLIEQKQPVHRLPPNPSHTNQRSSSIPSRPNGTSRLVRGNQNMDNRLSSPPIPSKKIELDRERSHLPKRREKNN